MVRLAGGIVLIFIAISSVWAQDATTVEQRIEALRAQLRDVTEKETQLQARGQQLDEDM
jgi:hypothetical protein